MDSLKARKFFAEYANAISYIDVETKNGDRAIGSAFHIGEGVFVTARHLVENCQIIEIKITEPVGITQLSGFVEKRIALFFPIPKVLTVISIATKKKASNVF